MPKVDVNSGEDFQVRHGWPETSEAEKLAARYRDLYGELEKAIAKQDGTAYMSGLYALRDEMMKETIAIRGEGGKDMGDAPNTFKAWRDAVGKRLEDYGEKLIMNRRGVKVLSNTMTNNPKVPHRDLTMYDFTLEDNSSKFGSYVVDFVNIRGGGYITANLVDGHGDETSYYQVETTFRGLPPSSELSVT